MSGVDGDAELLREVMDAFLIETPRMLDLAREGIAMSQPRDVQRAAHTVKGSLRLFGPCDAGQAAEHLEMTAKSGDLSLARDDLAALEAQLDEILPEIRRVAEGDLVPESF
jgi:HPt (histidine-containing phosphotransfer) domain-containing protein